MKLRMPKAALPRAKKPGALRQIKRAVDAGRKLAEVQSRRSQRES